MSMNSEYYRKIDTLESVFPVFVCDTLGLASEASTSLYGQWKYIDIKNRFLILDGENFFLLVCGWYGNDCVYVKNQGRPW